MESDQADDPLARLAATAQRLRAGRAHKVGFPGADDIDYKPVWELLFSEELNNIGDPYQDPTFDHHSKDLEQEAVDFFAGLFGADDGDHWGYVTTGGTECLQFGLLRARNFYPDGVAYHSSAAHFKVPRILDDFRMPSVEVPADKWGVMDYEALDKAVGAHPGRPAIVVATAGTTMTEAVDDVARIHTVLDSRSTLDRYVHVDAALAGVPLALLPEDQRPAFDFRAGADSIGVSLHKFLATRMPGGVVITRATPPPSTHRQVEYTGTADTVMTCSRNGHMAALAWYCIRTLGREGLRRRAEQGRTTAAWLVDALAKIGWPAWRHPTAFTVVLDPPPDSVLRRWHLPVQDGQCHYVCLPGRTIEQACRFVADLAEATSGPHTITHGQQRKPHHLRVARTVVGLARRGAA